MKFFIDTADIDEIKRAHAMGMVDGVTTNPSLVAKTGRPFHDVLKDILAVVEGPISAEVVATDSEGMVKEGRALAKLHDNIVVKIPMMTEGLRAVRTLTAEGVRTNVTLIFSPTQALLAAKAGATYVSPFVGRLDDMAKTADGLPELLDAVAGDHANNAGAGMAMVAQILEIYGHYDFDTQVLVASVRSPMHVLTAARMGADVATIPYAVIEQLAKHPLTDAGLKKFLADWEKVPKAK